MTDAVRKWRWVPLELKHEAIDRYHAGEPAAEVCRAFKVHRSTLQRWQVQLDRRKIDNPEAVYVTHRRSEPPRRVPDRVKYARLFGDVPAPDTPEGARDLCFERAALFTARGRLGEAGKWTRAAEHWERVIAVRRRGPSVTAAQGGRAASPGGGGDRVANPGAPFVPHAAQVPPSGPGAEGWRTWLFMGGRGAGKTRAGAEWLAAAAEADGAARLALVGPSLHDVREVMIDGPSGLLNLPGRERPRYEPARRRLRWANGAVAFAFSAEDPESLRGPQFSAAWADEFCVWPDPAGTLALLRMGLRLGGTAGAEPRLVVTTTPKPLAALRRLIAEPGCVLSRAATRANAENLAPAFLEGVEALYGGTRLAAQEIEGALVEAEAGALWRAEELARCRGPAPERLDRVVVAVDPPASATGPSTSPAASLRTSACGIVVAGRRGERAYVLADRTARGLSPLGWARRAAEAAAEWGATEIVAEANQGGEMVRATLAGAAPSARVKLVHATRSKRTRAEPVAALYEQGRVTHCTAPGGAGLAALEGELMALGGDGSPEGSPDRADALVWALTELMLGPPPQQPRIRVL